jgi:hypothetical protein
MLRYQTHQIFWGLHGKEGETKRWAPLGDGATQLVSNKAKMAPKQAQ